MKYGKPIDENKLRLPSTLDMTLAGNIVTYAGRFEKLEDIAGEVRDYPTTIFDIEHNCVKFISNSGQSTFFMPADDVGVASGRSKVEMVFTFLLCVVSETLQRRGSLPDNCVSFELNDLVELGIYNDVRTARVGINEIMHYLTGIRISSSRNVTKSFLGSKHTILVSSAEIKNGVVNVWLGRGIDWQFACAQYVDMPKEMFALSPNAFKVVKAIYIYIRTNRISQKFKYPMMQFILKSGITINQNQSKRTFDAINSVIEEINNQKGLNISLKLLLSSKKNFYEILKTSSILVLIRGNIKKDMKGLDEKLNALQGKE